MQNYLAIETEQPQPTYLQIIATALDELRSRGAGVGEVVTMQRNLLDFGDRTLSGGVVECGRGVVVRFPPKNARNATGFRGVEVMPTSTW